MTTEQNLEKNIKEATKQWIESLTKIPQQLLNYYYGKVDGAIDYLHELTTIQEGDYGWSNELQNTVEIVEVDKNNEKLIVSLNNKEYTLDKDDVFVERESLLPMWGTLFEFDNAFDNDWIMENLDIVTKCGFRIFEDEKLDMIFLGIDGAGYDFYEAHWIPLYKKRGLKWHEGQLQVNATKTKRDAAQCLVDSMNMFTHTFMETLYGFDSQSELYLSEITPIVKGDQAYAHSLGQSIEVLSVNEEEGTVLVTDGDEEFTLEKDELDFEKGFLPMWGTMFSFNDPVDNHWLSENLEEMAKCGFRIYEDTENDMTYFGIDGAGYDFYEAHWIPLYETMGYKWHTEE